MRPILRPALMLLLAAGLSACATATTASRPLAGTRWVYGPERAHNTPELQFSDGRLSGSTGCNRLMGSYKSDGSTVTWGPIATTLMACSDPDNPEREVITMLNAAKSARVEGQELILRDASGKELGRYRAADGQ